jgi:cyclohexa-1,5-dienecarbonyl-CoA hydratase
MKGFFSATRLSEGRVLRLALSSPPKNILDGAALRELLGHADDIAADHRLKAVLLTADGPNFSFGASIQEHTRRSAPLLLASFATAAQALSQARVPIVSAVSGQCLGGGLELALLGTRVIAHRTARLGQPEIRLAAFAPLASILLPRRVGQARAEELLLTGRIVDAPEALAIGLVDEVTEGDPEEAALAWIRTALLPHSAAALRLACRAARYALSRELDAILPVLDAIYQNELLATDDAEEGIRAFTEKRAPVWKDM